MNGAFELPTIVFLLLAVLVIARLVSVLGRKTGNERPIATARRPDGDNVIPLPRAGGDQRQAAAVQDPNAKTPEDRIQGVAPPGSALESGLLDVARRDSSFDPKAFLSGAGKAYEMIVMAFAEGDRKQLKTLTARDVFDGFAAAMGERERRGEINQTTFIGIHKSDLIEAEIKDSIARLTVKFLSQMITVVRDKAGKVIEGDAGQVRDVTDIWTFARDVASQDPNWKLVATQSAN
jgi:predicted lipid-binding transport protein (Tim44 family)